MALHRLWVSISSILTGWTVLLLIYYLLERPLLLWTGPILGGAWFATASLALECCALAATGWVIGLVCGWMTKRRARSDLPVAMLAFAISLSVWDFSSVAGVNIPWLLHLAIDTLGDARYLESLAATVVLHALLFGCLITGGRLPLPRQPEASVGRYLGHLL